MALGENWTVPEAVRKQIPQEWEPGQPNKKKPGWRWQDPMNLGLTHCTNTTSCV